MTGRSLKQQPVVLPAGGGLTVALWVALLASLVLFTVFLGSRQYVLLEHYDRIESMSRETEALQKEIVQLKWRLEAIAGDPFWTEKIARERMNYSVPGELIFRFRAEP